MKSGKILILITNQYRKLDMVGLMKITCLETSHIIWITKRVGVSDYIMSSKSMMFFVLVKHTLSLYLTFYYIIVVECCEI